MIALRNLLSLTSFFLLLGCTAEAASLDWENYRSTPFVENGKLPDSMPLTPDKRSGIAGDVFTFRDLKNDDDGKLAFRLLGAVGRRIAFVDRRKDRWYLYDSVDDPIESLELYTQPENWGSAYGICRVEKYTIKFDDVGMIEQVDVQNRFGIEGPIFQMKKDETDWDQYHGPMCANVPADHAVSYFPASGILAAKDLARLLVTAVHEASGSQELSFKFSCQTYAGKECSPGAREYLGLLRMSDINETSRINCGYASKPEEHCFTILTGKHQLGPFPKMITIRGSTYLNEIDVYSAEIREGFTIS